MAMVINTNVTANRTHNTYVHNNDAMNRALTRVATGMKINSAKDGASTWAISEKMRERIRANDQANQNVQNDTALLRTAQGGIDNTISILKTIKERALNAANDSNINTDREAIATEVLELVNQIDDNAQKVKFNGRALLNGAADTSVAAATAEETAAVDTSYIVEPTAAKVATGNGTHSIYESAALFKINKSDNSGTTTVASNTKLVDLIKSGSAGTGDKVFKAGDTITFSWKEDGQDQTKTIQVTSDTQMSDLDFNYGALKVAYQADTVTAGASVKDKDGNQAYKADGAVAADLTQYKLSAVGDQGVSITDLKVAVTYDDYGTTKTRVDAQTSMAFAQGALKVNEPTEGSHSVFALENLKVASTIGATGGADTFTTDTQLGKLAVATTANANLFYDGVNAIDAGGTITFKVGDVSIDFKATDTVADLIGQFKDKGIAVVAGVASNNGLALKDLEGDVVLTGTGTDAKNYNIATNSIYFISEKGGTIDNVTMSAVMDDGTKLDHVATKYMYGANEVLTTESAEEAEEATPSASTPLTFYVGGEANFGIDVTINKMTTEALLGNDSKTFSDMFKSKDALNINSTDPTKNVISIIDNAIQTALNEQTKLGAMEARLGYTSDNITTMNENLEAADSAYRDSDIAKEMTNYMKYSVLAQASQYMLAQAGQNAYSVLNLLQQ